MNDLISIIVPVYNAEKYLSECIESVLRQTYKNIELILIDDGSIDESGKICDDYASSHPCIKVIHKPNAGVSSARNIGLDYAAGSYITFVDADDFITENCLSKMYSNLCENHSDMVFCGMGTYDGNTIVSLKEELPTYENLSSGNKAKLQFAGRFFNSEKYISSSACRVLYKKTIIEYIRFNTNIRIGEDWIFLLHTILNARAISSVKDIMYLYRTNFNSATHSYYKDYLNNQLSIHYELQYLFGEMVEAKDLLDGYFALLCYHAFSNEIKNRETSWRFRIKEIRHSKLYSDFKLNQIFKIRTTKKRIKYLVILLLVKLRLV